MLNQDVFGAKVRLFGDVVYGNTMVPQVAVGAQYNAVSTAPSPVRWGQHMTKVSMLR